MFKTLYVVNVYYENELESGMKQFELYALSDENAKNIATEMYSTFYGIPKRINVMCVPREPSVNVSLPVIALAKTLVSELNATIHGKDYSGFLTLFDQYKGYGLMLNRDTPFFNVDLGVLVFRVVYDRPITGIDKKVLVRYNNIEYIVDNFSTVYFGKA